MEREEVKTKPTGVNDSFDYDDDYEDAFTDPFVDRDLMPIGKVQHGPGFG